MIRRIVLAGLVTAVVAASPADATEVKIFQTQTQSGFRAGTLEGISVDPLGRLQLADRVERLTAIGEPFLLAAAAHPQGWVVGTGNAGRVLLVRRDGTVDELFAAPEPEVFAVAADPDGTVWAGTSPNGKLYRIPPGGPAEPWFTPGETYIWAIERGPGDALLLATGTQGRLYRVAGKDRGAVVYDSDDTHLRALAVAGGEVLVGTAGEGLVLVLQAQGDAPWSARTVHDAREPEVVALTVAPDGTRYAAVVASEASLVDLSSSSSASSSSSSSAGGDDGGSESGQEGGTVTVTVSTPSAATSAAGGTRAAGYSGPRSTLLAISPAGVVETLTRLQDDTVFDLLFHRGSLWIATGVDGELYRWSGSELVLEKDVDERQIVALLPGDPGPAFATTNAAALFRVAGGTEREGLYTSATLDAEQIARFGTFRWRGEVPAGGDLAFSFRSGISSEPDRTWSEWTPWQGAGGGGRDGGELALAALPRGRYAQWRARFEAGQGRGEGASPLLYGIELTYRQENLRPRFTDLDVLEPGRILVPANFNPGSQVFEPVSPSRDSIFTTLQPGGDGDPRLKTLWKPGFRSLTWDAEDDNDDELVYSLGFQRAGAAAGFSAGEGDEDAAGGEGWLTMAEELDAEHFSFDATVLPDGVYRFRVVVSDRPANPAGAALTAERVSEPVVVDHTPPALVSVAAAGAGRLRVVLEDGLLPLRQVRLSRDAAEWSDLTPEDGLLDGRRESFLVDSGGAAALLLLQSVDAAYNGATYDLRRSPQRTGTPSTTE
ncbi:MAG TPA: hypothetical protein VHQ65_07830 [Thermoanaerobaculia bacterium]|nr:hypothetical protein [Thermoanaerobaculia bacterium]